MSKPVKSTPLVCSGHTRPIPSLHFSCPSSSSSSAADPDYLLISSCKDGKPQLRNWLGDWLGTFVGHKGAVWSSRLSIDGTRAVTGSGDFTAKLWDTTSGTSLVTLTHNHIVRSVDINSTSSHVLTGGAEKKLRLWDLSRCFSSAKGENEVGPNDEGVCVEFKEGTKDAHEGTIKTVLFDDERRTVISMGEDKVVKWWDPRTLSPIHSITFPDPITSLSFATPNSSSTDLALTTGHSIQLYSLLEPLSSTPTTSHLLSYKPSTISLHPTQDLFVTGSINDNWVRLHALSSGHEVEIGKGHHGPVHCISFSPDGEMYVSGGEDGTLRMWQTTPKDWGLWKYH